MDPKDIAQVKTLLKKHGNDFWKKNGLGDSNTYLFDEILELLAEDGLTLVLVRKTKIKVGGTDD